jgi:hypothetical protein
MTYFKLSELPFMLGVCHATVARWIKSGKLEYVELSPRRRLVSEESLLQFIEARTIRHQPAKRVDRRPVVVKNPAKLKTYADNQADDLQTLRKEIRALWQ